MQDKENPQILNESIGIHKNLMKYSVNVVLEGKQ